MASETSKIREFHSRVLELNGGAWFDFEPHLSALYRAILQSGSIAVDGGANIGLHTLQMAQAVLPDGLVIAIEPVPESLAHLDARRIEHHMPDGLIRKLPYGLCSTAGEADFYQVIDPIQHELSGLRNRRCMQNQQVKKIRVELTTLDTVCQDLQRLDFLKLDLEGAELDALRGGMQTLSRFRPVVALEQDQYSPQYFGYTWDDLLNYFASLNYAVYDLFGLHYTEPSMLDLCAVWDFVGLPAEYPDKDALFDAVRRSMELAGAKFAPTDPEENGVDIPPASGIGPNLKPRGRATACALDSIGSVSNPRAEASVHVPGDQEIQFSGWAIDEPDQTAAGGVDLLIDQTPYRALYGVERTDVAHHFRNGSCQASGFVLILAPETLAKGQHVVSLRVISCDNTSYYQGPTVRFTVD
jgi:FkbM family methyltransferase